MNRIRAFAVLNFLSLFAQIGFSYLTQNKLLNQWNVGEISARHESLFTPAGITFIIWGIIYTGLGILCLYHLIIAFTKNADHEANRNTVAMDGLFIFNNLATIAWLLAWTHDQILASVLLIFIQLITLVAIHSRLHIYNPSTSVFSKLFTQIPLSIYLGWITIATIANTSSYLVSVGWSGLGLSAIQWSIILVSLATIIAILMIIVRRNIAFGLVVIWGLYGIIIKRQSIDSFSSKVLIMTLWASVAIIAIVCIIRIISSLNYKRPAKTFPQALTFVK